MLITLSIVALSVAYMIIRTTYLSIRCTSFNNCLTTYEEKQCVNIKNKTWQCASDRGYASVSVGLQSLSGVGVRGGEGRDRAGRRLLSIKKNISATI